MEGASSYNNPPKPMPSNLGGKSNNAPLGAGNDDNEMFFTGSSSETHTLAMPLAQWVDCPKAQLSYYEFLADTKFLEDGSPSDALRGISPPLDILPDVKGFSDVQSEKGNNCSWMTCGLKPSDGFSHVDIYDLKPYAHMLNSVNVEASLNARCLTPRNEEQPENKRQSSQHQSQINNSWMYERSTGNVGLPQIHPRVMVAPSACLSKPSKDAALRSGRERRLRIAAGLKALQELLPYPVNASQAGILDEVIDYIKYLQLQMRELSQSRLGGEATSGDFISIQGYGHSFVYEQMRKEHLEEMVGKLLEINPSVASNLLQSKGLVLMPMALADNLEETIFSTP
ncbi:hypothetical protein K2173_003057 [Erythroxylum novogranatense]|uniref:BHLH domain-containing protein n=1 Tax=Erythroxylum novogranatense TaxID=1862640 RepID=A0AAV8S8C8_9ROSI|nr:hypothetical protein K2173_003057 [Erythroxylum novogranatense]